MSDLVKKYGQAFLNEYMGEEDPVLVVHGLFLFVGVDSTGERFITVRKTDDLRTWEAKGMLEDARDSLAAMEVARMFEVEDE